MIRALIVEDDPMVALINKKYLIQIGDIEVVDIVMYEEEVIDVLKNEKIDLVLLDVYLPGKNGIEILNTMRKLNFFQDVIMITADNNSNELQKALALGVVDYLIKPFDFKRFEMAINKFKFKNNVITKNEKITQEELDAILNNNVDIDREVLPKGLNRRTLEKVTSYLMIHDNEYLTIREISKALKISNVTIKKYMDYFESIGKVSIKIEYGNVGRPEFKYYFKK
ncbi:MAG: response regulator [Clostridium sp.]|nr:response regulator [Clostridium sp.]